MTAENSARIFTGLINWNLNYNDKKSVLAPTQQQEHVSGGEVRVKVKIEDLKNVKFRALIEHSLIFENYVDFMKQSLKHHFTGTREFSCKLSKGTTVVVSAMVQRSIRDQVCDKIYEWTDEFLLRSVEQACIETNVRLAQNDVFLETWLRCLRIEESFRKFHFQLVGDKVLCSSILKNLKEHFEVSIEKGLPFPADKIKQLSQHKSWNEFMVEYTGEKPDASIAYRVNSICLKGPILDVVYLQAATHYKIYSFDNAEFSSTCSTSTDMSLVPDEDFFKRDFIKFDNDDLFPQLLYIDKNFFKVVQTQLAKSVQRYDGCSVDVKNGKHMFTVNYFISSSQNPSQVKHEINDTICDLVFPLIQNVELQTELWGGYESKCPKEFIDAFVGRLDEVVNGTLMFRVQNGVITVIGYKENLQSLFDDYHDFLSLYEFVPFSIYSAIPMWTQAKRYYEANPKNLISLRRTCNKEAPFEVSFKGDFVDSIYMWFLTRQCCNKVLSEVMSIYDEEAYMRAEKGIMRRVSELEAAVYDFNRKKSYTLNQETCDMIARIIEEEVDKCV